MKWWIKPAMVAILVFVVSIFAISGCVGSPTGTELKGKPMPQPQPPVSENTSNETQQKPSLKGGMEGYEIYENKDPFQPLIGKGSATTVTTTTTTTPGGGITTTSATATLLSISPDGTKANISISGTTYSDLKAGDTFAESYKLLSIGTGSVTILYGDNQYTLYLGETLTLK